MSAVRPTQRFAVAPLNDRFRESQFGRRTARICANLPGHGAASARTRGPGWRRWEKSVAGFDRFGWPTLDHYGRLGWSIVTGWIARHTQFSVRTHLCGPRLPGCGRPKALSASVRAKDLSVVGRDPVPRFFQVLVTLLDQAWDSLPASRLFARGVLRYRTRTASGRRQTCPRRVLRALA
jgi:hypothetical protein